MFRLEHVQVGRAAWAGGGMAELEVVAGTPRRVALLGCGKSKAARTCTAEEMYRSGLFRSALRWALATCDEVFILSARHGLLERHAVIEPYDEVLPRRRAARARWGARVAAQLDAAVPDLDALVVVLAGERYADAIADGIGDGDRDYLWEEPLRGLQLGERLSWLKRSGRM